MGVFCHRELPSSEIPDSYFEIDDYTMFRKDQNRFGGGIIIYCRSDLNSKPSLVSLHCDTFESLSINHNYEKFETYCHYCHLHTTIIQLEHGP